MPVKELRPSDFVSFPHNSKLKNETKESLALLIMKTQADIDDDWNMSYTDFLFALEKSRSNGQKGPAFYVDREQYRQITYHIGDAIGAMLFSPEWQQDAQAAFARHTPEYTPPARKPVHVSNETKANEAGGAEDRPEKEGNPSQAEGKDEGDHTEGRQEGHS
jgi:hypothetical protein